MALSSDYLINIINDLIDKKLAESTHIAIGQISAYDADKYLVKVFLAYEQIETPWIRLGGGATGNLFGDKVPPSIDDEVIVAFYSGTLETGVVISRLYSDPTDPPPDAAAGDRVMRHVSGAQISFKEGGSIAIAASEKVVATLDPAGSFTVSNGAADVKIKADNSIELTNAQTSIKMTAGGKVQIANSGAELISLLSQLMSALTTSPNIQVVVPSGVGGFNPVVGLALQNIQTLLNTLKV